MMDLIHFKYKLMVCTLLRSLMMIQRGQKHKLASSSSPPPQSKSDVPIFTLHQHLLQSLIKFMWGEGISSSIFIINSGRVYKNGLRAWTPFTCRLLCPLSNITQPLTAGTGKGLCTVCGLSTALPVNVEDIQACSACVSYCVFSKALGTSTLIQFSFKL